MGGVFRVLIGWWIVMLFFLIVLEWMAGCGEVYRDSRGTTHPYGCVFLPFGDKR
jgi:hypothetical protein